MRGARVRLDCCSSTDGSRQCPLHLVGANKARISVGGSGADDDLLLRLAAGSYYCDSELELLAGYLDNATMWRSGDP